ncbi:MAG TPA: hypothetical protein VGM70_04660 [Pseudolysinimonas sp.]|jgi:hypothetical protein
MSETRVAAKRGRSTHGETAWLSKLASVLAQATRVAVRLRPDGLLELSDRGEVLGYIEYVKPVYVAHVGECPQFAVEVGQRATLAAAVDDVRRHSVMAER